MHLQNRFTALWQEPRAPGGSGPTRRDWLLVAFVAVLCVIEGTLRKDLVWPLFTIALPPALMLTLPWRRTAPLRSLLIAFTINGLVQNSALVMDIPWTNLFSTVFLLILPYALLRWATGREIIIGLVFVYVSFAINITLARPPLPEVFAGSVFILLPCALGATARFRDMAQRRGRAQVRLAERERLARELHDTVAHHVSAIAVQAQAGQALAATDPNAPTAVLATIEQAASATLAEMRQIVRTLRDEDTAPRAPSVSMIDLQQLINGATSPFPIRLHTQGDLEPLDSALWETLYRLCQESITNAVRHASGAEELVISLTGDSAAVRFEARDDGERVSRPGESGFGLAGMRERVSLLRGTFAAQPGETRGWIVTATLPRGGDGR
ncbi:MAG: histidine kinase [Pseudomonadota bacterium]